MADFDSNLGEDDYDDFDEMLECPPPPFDETDDDYSLKVLSHHVKGTYALLLASLPSHEARFSNYPILRVLVALKHP